MQQSLLTVSRDALAERAGEVARQLARPAPTRPVAPPAARPAPAPAPAPLAAPEAALAATAPATDPTPAEPPRRAWDAPREAIRLPCGRVVVRELEGGVHRYQLWEPVDGAEYSVTRVDKGGKTWGLSRSRRYNGALPENLVARHGVLVDHERELARRAVEVLRASVPELWLRESVKPGVTRPAGVASGVFESCGDVILMGRPSVVAALAVAQRRGGT